MIALFERKTKYNQLWDPLRWIIVNICNIFNHCQQYPKSELPYLLSREAATDLVQSRLGPLEKIARVCVGHVKASIHVLRCEAIATLVDNDDL